MSNETPRVFTILLQTEATLTVDELWPDGDAPLHPSPDDVDALIEQSGGPDRVLSEWSLGPLDVEVSTWPPLTEEE